MESQKRLAAFNGTIQQAGFEAERRGFLRNIESGYATGGGTAALSEGYQSLLDELQPIRDSVTNDIAIALRGAVASLTWLVQGIKTLNDWNLIIPVLPKLLQKLIDNTSKDEDKASTNFDEWMNFQRGRLIAGNGVAKK